MMRSPDYLEGYTEGFSDGWDQMELIAILLIADYRRNVITTNQQLGDYVENLRVFRTPATTG